MMSNTKGIVIIGNKQSEWLLPWWKINYLMNNALPVVFVDNGLSQTARRWCEMCAQVIKVPEPLLSLYPKNSETIKALSLLISPFEKTLLIEPYMQVRGDLSAAFDFLSDTISFVTAPNSSDTSEISSELLLIQKHEPFIKLWLEKASESKKDSLKKALQPYAEKTLILPAIYNWAMDRNGENPFACVSNHKSPMMKSYIKQQIQLLENIVFMKVSFPREKKKRAKETLPL